MIPSEIGGTKNGLEAPKKVYATKQPRLGRIIEVEFEEMIDADTFEEAG